MWFVPCLRTKAMLLHPGWYQYDRPAPTDPFRSADKACRDKGHWNQKNRGRAWKHYGVVKLLTLNFWIFKQRKKFWRTSKPTGQVWHLFASERQLRIGGHYHCLNTNSTSYISNVMSCVSGRISNLFNRDLAYSWLRPVPSLSHLPACRFTRVSLTSGGHLLSFYLTHIRYCSSVWIRRNNSCWFGKTCSTKTTVWFRSLSQVKILHPNNLCVFPRQKHQAWSDLKQPF